MPDAGGRDGLESLPEEGLGGDIWTVLGGTRGSPWGGEVEEG